MRGLHQKQTPGYVNTNIHIHEGNEDMATVPSRSRSLRKPSEAGTRRTRESAQEPGEDSVRLPEPRPRDKHSQSPSRLPIKPPTRSVTSTSARPPSAASSIVSNASIRPSARANIGRSTTGGPHRAFSTRQSNSSQSSEPLKQDRSRPPLTTSRHLRNPSASAASAAPRAPSHTRAKSSSTVSTAAPVLLPPTRGSTEESASRQTLAEPQIKKPFSALQQHFSPVKNLAPKPHPAAFLAPPSPSKLPSNIAISAEISKLQNELLQLHLLHRDAALVDKEWRASAKRKLGDHFQSVVDRNEALIELEIEEMCKINAAAFQNWQSLGTPGLRLEEKVQILDEVVNGVWNLGESGGKYARTVRKFERWLGKCQYILEARARNGEEEDEEILFIEELDASWKDDCLILGRKLESWQCQLRDLESPGSRSSLATVTDGCGSLIEGMLMELAVMVQIERDAMNMEVQWIKNMNDDIMVDDQSKPAAGAIWRSR